MSIQTRPTPGPSRPAERAEVLQVIVYGHSALFYWRPLWAVGYVMALLTSLHSEHVIIGSKPEMFHPSRNLGVIYTLLLLLLIVITSTNVRGMRAALIIVGLSFLTLLFAYLGWWGGNSWVFLGREAIYHEPWLLPFLVDRALRDLARNRSVPSTALNLLHVMLSKLGFLGR